MGFILILGRRVELVLNFSFYVIFNEERVVLKKEVARTQPSPICHSAFTQYVRMG